MANGRIRITTPGEVELTLTMTLKLKDWEALGQQLRSEYPSWKLGGMIRRLVDQATTHFDAEVEIDG